MTGDTLGRLLVEVAGKRPVVLVTALATGESRLVNPFAPTEGEDPAVAAAAREAAVRDASAKLETATGILFLRPYNPPVRVVVIGAVHLAQPFVRMVALAGYEPVVVDPRRPFASEGRFEGVRLVREWPDVALASIGLDRRTAVVTMTHDPKFDDPALSAALRSPAFYLGALGSKRTHAARRERLRGEGFSDADLARIHGPVGLAIGARSPGEIAVSILAQLVAALRGPAAAAGEA